MAASHEHAAAQSYWVYAAAESEDEVALLRYDAGGDLVVEKTIITGWLRAEIEAPHGLAMDPAGEYWYLTLGHGFPNGRLVKYATGADTVAGVADLGLFPATIAIPPHGAVALTVNANFHGDHVPSTVTIVDLETMFPIADVVTCTMPHGSRFNADGTKHYSACMMDNQLVEIDGATLDVTRRLDLIANRPAMAPMEGHMAMAPPGENCSPTWTTPHPDGRRVFVPCNKGDVILEVDLEAVARHPPHRGPRCAVQPGPYTRRHQTSRHPEGQRQAGNLGCRNGQPAAHDRLPHARDPRRNRDARRPLRHRDGRGHRRRPRDGGGDRNRVRARRVASAEIGKQAGGIALWKMEG